MKTAPGATEVGMQNCAEDSTTLLTQLLDTVKGDSFVTLPHLHQEPQLLSGSHLLKLPHPSQVPPVPYSPSHLPAFALPRLPAPQAFVCLLTSNPDSLQPGCVGVFALLEVYGIQIFKTQALPSRGLKSPQNEKKQMYNR